MGGLQRGQNPLQLREPVEGFQGLLVRHGRILGPLYVVVEGVLRPHGGVIQPGGDAVGLLHLAPFVLQNVGLRAVKHPDAPVDDRGRVPLGRASGFDAQELDVLVVRKRVKRPDGVAPAAHAGHEKIREPPFLAEDLPLDLVADYPLKVPHDLRIGVGADDGAD